MENKERSDKEKEIRKQLGFCTELLSRLKNDFEESVKKQDIDPYDDFRSVLNHTRFETDTVRIRRELVTLTKLFREAR